jgi:hypothetical protein
VFFAIVISVFIRVVSGAGIKLSYSLSNRAAKILLTVVFSIVCVTDIIVVIALVILPILFR